MPMLHPPISMFYFNPHFWLILFNHNWFKNYFFYLIDWKSCSNLLNSLFVIFWLPISTCWQLNFIYFSNSALPIHCAKAKCYNDQRKICNIPSHFTLFLFPFTLIGAKNANCQLTLRGASPYQFPHFPFIVTKLPLSFS